MIFRTSAFCALFAFSSAAFSYQPEQFLNQRVAELKNTIDTRPGIARMNVELETRATRNAWLKELYANNIVEATELTRNMADKLVMAKLVEAYLGDKASFYYPKTIGLKAFLNKHKLLDAQHGLIRDPAKIQAAIQTEFPHGAIVKPAAAMNSAGKGEKFFFKIDKFIAALVKEDSNLYKAADYAAPFASEMLKTPTSGEELILQENVISAAGETRPLVTKEVREIRLHTFEDKIIPHATYSRWAEQTFDKELTAKAEVFAQSFLDGLPRGFLARHAWSMDVMVMDNGVMRIIDINTNRGEKIHWSGYLPRPSILKAYVDYMEKEKVLHIAGFSGYLFRAGVANQFKYWKQYYIEGIR